MSILNVVKVLCFDTLLQVLILKVVKVAISGLLQPFAKWATSETPEGASEGREWSGKRQRGGVRRRGRGFEIWAGTGATMGKGSAGVFQKYSKKQRMVKIRGRTAIRSSKRRRAEEKNSRAPLVLEVGFKPGPFQTKGSGTQILPFAKDVPPAFVFPLVF